MQEHYIKQSATEVGMLQNLGAGILSLLVAPPEDKELVAKFLSSMHHSWREMWGIKFE